MGPNLKPVLFQGSSLEVIRSFPGEARREAGYQLYRLQCGRSPSDARPLSTVGPGVSEIRVHAKGEHRVIYLTRFSEAVYVLHSFTKKTRRTQRRDLELARERLLEVIRGRSDSGGQAREE